MDPEYVRELLANLESMQTRIQHLEGRTASTPATSSTPSLVEVQLASLLERLGPTSPSLVPTMPVQPIQRSEKHPDPKPFDGNPKDLDRFTSQLYVKLRMNADRYPTEEQRVGYAFSRLDGDAAIAMEGF